MSFLTAEWRKLILANYSIDKKILEPYLPYGTELDLWNNTCYVSLVGFMFCNTRLLGVKIPYHTNFEEVNLRFYVRYQDGEVWKRGVVFIKEIVPKPALTFVANTIYKEHYQTLPMRHKWVDSDNDRWVEYEWQSAKQWNKIGVKALLNAEPIQEASEAEFIAEHYWGYTKINDRKTFEYEVKHPRWQMYPVIAHQIKIDFEEVYGSAFKILNEARPISVFLAEGSAIAVENKREL